MPKVVEVENLSKKYMISHETQSAYCTLVETLSYKAKNLIKKLRHPLADTHEKTFEEFWSLKDVSMEIEEGDRVGIIGRNGAGKSTLLKILSRIVSPTSGRVKITGRVASLLEVGTGFHPELTGRENIFLNGAILGMKKQEIIKNFEQIVDFAGIEQFLDTPVKRYSSGMYTRLGFAIAAHLDPDLLIVDEVLAVGDASFQQKCLKKMNDLGAEGRTILFVSHDISAILSLCNKGVYLEKGRVEKSGLIDDCVNAYSKTTQVRSLSWKGNVGDENVRFYRAYLETDTPEKEFFYQGEKTKVVIDYEVLQPCPDLVLALNVWNFRGQLLGRTHTYEDPSHHQLYHQMGRHQISFELDSALFHEGDYNLFIKCFLYNKKNIVCDDIVLKYTVFAKREETRFATEGGGIFLGSRWNYESSDKILQHAQ